MLKVSKKTSEIIQCPNCAQKGNIHKVIYGKFNIYFCKTCHNGFVYPIPDHIEKYYQDYYWDSPNIVGKIKNIAFDIFQRRRVRWLTKNISKGDILDIGAGRGSFGASLPLRYRTVNIEPPNSKVKSKHILKKDFLKWKTDKKFDAITFWESLEHTSPPQSYLSKAYKLLKRGGFIFIEFPRYDSLESRIFGKNWFHLDPPRHLSHLTNTGITILLKQAGFRNIKTRSVLAYEYAPWGLTASLLNNINIRTINNIKKSRNILLFISTIPIITISLIFEIIFFLIDQSPITLAIAEKNE